MGGTLAWKAVGLMVLNLLTAVVVHAQELEARAFSPAPIGTKIIVAGVGGQAGAILFDPALDIDDAAADLTIGITAVGYTFGIAGRQARVLGVFPMAWGDIDGRIGPMAQHPAIGRRMPAMVRISVDLPDPLAPTTAVSEPRRTTWSSPVSTAWRP